MAASASTAMWTGLSAGWPRTGLHAARIRADSPGVELSANSTAFAQHCSEVTDGISQNLSLAIVTFTSWKITEDNYGLGWLEYL